MELNERQSPSPDLDDERAIAALISDLYWQIDQLPRRGVKNAAANPYHPSYYIRGLNNAIDRGGLAVVEYVRSFLTKPPSEGYRKLEEADSLDLTCEALVADSGKPYAHLFREEDRNAARARLAPHLEAIRQRKAAASQRIANQRSALPTELDALGELARAAQEPEAAIAINEAIVHQTPRDIAALNRLGRAYASIGSVDEARAHFRRVLELDPENNVATQRLQQLEHRARSRSS